MSQYQMPMSLTWTGDDGAVGMWPTALWGTATTRLRPASGETQLVFRMRCNRCGSHVVVVVVVMMVVDLQSAGH